MGRVVPAGIKEPFEVPPQGLILWKVEGLTNNEKEVEADPSKRLMYAAALTAAEPKEVEGLTHTESFFVGTDDDPGALKSETWIKRSGRLKQFVENCGVQFEGEDMDMVASNVKDRKALGLVTHRLEPAMKGGKENPYAGRTRANVSRWFTEGEKAPYVEKGAPPSNGSQQIPAPPSPQASAARPVNPPGLRPQAIPKRIGG